MTRQPEKSPPSDGDEWLAGDLSEDLDSGRSLFQEVMSSFSGTIEPVRRTPLYRVGVLMVAGAVILLPFLYIALIGLLGWGVYWHATMNGHIATMGQGRARIFAVLMYFAPILAGGIAVIFMFKPLLARRTRRYGQVSLNRGRQSMLFAFVEKICDSVHAPYPTRIESKTP